MNKFEEFSLSNEIIDNLNKEGIVEPTVVQKKAIPLVMQGHDILVQSKTGSGKTIGFALPTINKLRPDKTVRVLVITPTRELANQVGREYVKFSRNTGLVTSIVYGGVSVMNQESRTRQADIVVGTPGRLLDLIRRQILNLSSVKCLVLDEADRLMDMGFIEDIDAIITHLPSDRQNLLFSATMNSHVQSLASSYLSEPREVFLDNIIKKGTLKQVYYNVREFEKISLLVHLLRQVDRELTLIFCNTKRKTRLVNRALKDQGIRSECLNGDMTQGMREQVMKAFADKKINVLVATDVAARGIHVDDISHVINFDLHDQLETYTHRIGRTARNGEKGTAITLLSDRDWYKMDKVMSKYGEELVEERPGQFRKVRVRPLSNHRNFYK